MIVQSDDARARALFDPYGAVTHEVINQPVELADFNLYDSDAALKEAVRREGAEWAANSLGDFGARTGSADYLELGALANSNPPELDTHDRYGRRVDLVRFHPAYHELMKLGDRGGPAFLAVDRAARGRACRARRALLHAEPGRGRARLPDHHDLRRRALPEDCSRIWRATGCRRSSRASTTRATSRPTEKQGLTIGMAMTEKQGGSDVRANTTRAIPVGAGGPGQAYELVGHKFFVSAPMCDAFLVLAQAPGGLSCFLVPRWRPDGTKNPLQIVRLKRKMGNVSNASSETELRGALGWMVGPGGPGRRDHHRDGGDDALRLHDRLVGRHAAWRSPQAIDHCRQRKAFGALLIDQPIMTAVLADLAIEAEAALTLTHAHGPRARPSRRRARGRAHPARHGDRQILDLQARARPRLRGDGMHRRLGRDGGFGPMPRLYREAPVNAIWEGSGNVQCLDIAPRHPALAADARRLFRGSGRRRRARAPRSTPMSRR